MLNPTRLLLDLQHVNVIARRISGILDATAVAHQVTDGLVARFNCAFARIWLVEPDRQYLRLVASSGLYTHTNGFFGRVPMGAYKVGKIAQNGVPFLSNHLADEPWVKDREWAIANNIKGFAGYPLAVGDRVIGVLVAFSHQDMAPEFLEMLQVLCMITTIALDAALQSSQSQSSGVSSSSSATGLPPLSEQLSAVLSSTHLMLLGTERPLPSPAAYAFLKLAEDLSELQCNYMRLTYRKADVVLEAIATLPKNPQPEAPIINNGLFQDVAFLALWLGGSLQTRLGEQQNILEVVLKIPVSFPSVKPSVRIQCTQPVIQIALMHLARLAGLHVHHGTDDFIQEDKGQKNEGQENEGQDDGAIAITNDEAVLARSPNAIWVCLSRCHRPPSQAKAIIDLSIHPTELKAIVEQISQGKSMVAKEGDRTGQGLSSREQEIMQLLATGLRDRDIAKRLFISESTVKFHINNSLAKLKAKNRYQGVYEAAIQGWI